jgi:hypothetical protein
MARKDIYDLQQWLDLGEQSAFKASQLAILATRS